MTRKLVYGFCILVAGLATVSCTKLESAGDKLVGPLAFKVASSANAIPEEYGSLIGVTQPRPAWTALWFQKPDKTLTAVFVNVEEGRIYEKGLTIPRK
jgi:hypothetical protein